MQAISQIEQLHATYCRLTGFNLSMKYDRERSWYEFSKAGFTQEDLRLVLNRLTWQVRKGERNLGSLRFSGLIGRLDNFEEERELARNNALRTRPEPSAKEKVIQVFRPTVGESVLSVNCKPAKVVMEKLIEQMRRAVE